MKKYVFAILVLSIALSLTSCLKDKEIEDQVYGMEGLEDIDLIEFPNSPRVTTTLDYSTIDTSFQLVTIRLNDEAPASEDIQVTLIPDESLVTDAGYAVAPSSIYTLGNLTVTIPAGSQEGSLTITAKPSELAADTYGFGFKIGAISNPKYTASGNFGTIVSVVPVKNKYDGLWEVSGTLVDAANAGITAAPPFNVELRTIDSKTVEMYNVTPPAGFAGLHLINAAGAVSAYGGFRPVVVFDATDNIVSVTNSFGQPNPANNRGAALDPTGVNKYDEATRTIQIKYFMTQPHPSVRTTFTETWTYKGRR